MKKYLAALGVLSLFLLSVIMVQAAEDTSWGKVKEQAKGTPEPAAKKLAKVDICHFSDDTGEFHIINISGNAVDKHIANHGDSFPSAFYPDADGDGFGDSGGTAVACPVAGFVENADDCNDGDANINPAATEVCGDGIDNNCDGDVDEGCVVLHAWGQGTLFTYQANPDGARHFPFNVILGGLNGLQRFCGFTNLIHPVDLVLNDGTVIGEVSVDCGTLDEMSFTFTIR